MLLDGIAAEIPAAMANIAPSNDVTASKADSNIPSDSPIDDAAPVPESPDRVYALVVG